jgi:hypothetical protein
LATGGVIVVRGLGSGLASVTTFLGVRIGLGAIGGFVIMLGAALGIVVLGLGLGEASVRVFVTGGLS